MDSTRLEKIIKKRLSLPEDAFEEIRNTPKYRRLFANAAKASRYRLIATVVESEGCHSKHRVNQKIVFDSSGNLLTSESPERICAFLMPNLVVLINAFFENLMNGRNPNEIMFNRTGCFDVGPACGGWGHVVVEMKAEARD